MTRWSFVVPIALSSANDRVVNGRHAVTRALYKRRRNAASIAIRIMAQYHGVPLLDRLPYVDTALRIGDPRPVRAVKVVRMIGARQRVWDDDNLVAACKALRDACQVPRVVRGSPVPGAAIVVDDSARWSSWSYAQERAADGKAAVRIEIEQPEEQER